MWLSTELFPIFFTQVTPELEGNQASLMSDDEVDIAHYIGGFVCCKIRQRGKTEGYKEVVSSLVSSSDPDPKTLVAAKSRGKLSNLTGDGKAIFKELEILFRNLFPSSLAVVNFEKYREACFSSTTVQDCFHNATDMLISDDKEHVLSDMIALYFKVRIHQKCKVIVQNVRSKKSASKQEKSLRSKLAK